MDWLKKFMAGRNGSDQLSLALLILYVMVTLVFRFTNLKVFLFLSYIPLVLCIFRMFSKDVTKRRMENYKFAMLISPVYSWFNKTIRRIQDLKTHKYFNCPNCRQTLRLPRNKGKISITCPKCKTEFIGKT